MCVKMLDARLVFFVGLELRCVEYLLLCACSDISAKNVSIMQKQHQLNACGPYLDEW